ncbi:citrate synthase/methylcitrate synthase [Paenibacillus filicis]|uniref:Citrate synthase n=1 Tax=Paenibacillus filicis TaxID=669464 RepID=A0ABU9DQ94_9BACL
MSSNLYVPGLEGIVATQTGISMVDGENGRLVYRGCWAKDLVIGHSFEEAAYLLWHGRLPDSKELVQLKETLQTHRVLPVSIVRLIEALPPDLDVMSALRTIISGMGGNFQAWPPTIDDGIRLTAAVPTIIAAVYRRSKGLPAVTPDPKLDTVAHYLYLLTGTAPTPSQVAAMSAYGILTMEHGLNASTFAARVVTSTASDLASAVCAAIGAMKGPLHGGAPSEVLSMLDEIGTKSKAEPWLRERLERGERLMGFGHRVYKTRDPRAEALRTVTASLTSDDPWLDLAVHVENTAIRLLEEYKPGRRLYTNVEFFAAAVMRSVSMPAELFTPTFTASRMVGWTAHIVEQAANNRIFRPQSTYTGTLPE